MRGLGRKLRVLSVALALGGGALMRLEMLKALPQITGDTLLYGNLAKHLLQGQYAITDAAGVTHETLIRLPGYPLLIAACFRLFGLDNYNAVSYVQIGLELIGCLLLAAFVRRIASEGAAHWTLWLSALCPFTASYAVAPLTETPTLFAIALALWAMARFHARPGWGNALAFTFAVTFAALLRPDGALVGLALAPAMAWGMLRALSASADSARKQQDAARSCPEPFWTRNRISWQPVNPVSGNRPSIIGLLRIGLVCALLALLPFVIWTARNWRVFHVFEPLAPRYATDPGDETYPGWQRWVKTWCLDFVSTYEIYWPVPGSPLELEKLPARAFDSAQQYEETAAVAADYNDRDEAKDILPDVDAGFARLAQDRIAAHRLRYYVWLPLGRVADMWLRPRVENLNIDLDWWVYSHHNAETRFSWAYAALNAAYLLLALAGLCFRPRYWLWMVAYFVLRSALLMTIEAPEARYTLECFPMIIALAGIGIWACCGKVARVFARR